MTLAYYNENDPFAAAWLIELIADGLIAPGIVDQRSIWDVVPNDLKGFTQCHFFAGIGVWSLALRLAGWPDDRPIWTGSAPCQPFSAAGKGDGFDDERHLWPAWYHLIGNAKPRDVLVVGEQVASKAGRAWFDLVSDDMEAMDHTTGAVDFSAAVVGAPFIGQRLYWLASTVDERMGQTDSTTSERNTGAIHRTESGVDGAGIAEHGSVVERHPDAGNHSGLATSDQQQHDGTGQSGSGGRSESSNRCSTHGMAAPTSGQSRQTGSIQSGWKHGFQPENTCDSRDGRIPLHPVEYWRDADWLLCRDPNGPRFRPVEPSTQPISYDRSLGRIVVDRSGAYQTHFPLTEKGEYLNRLHEIRGAGNALNVSQATCFIKAVME